MKLKDVRVLKRWPCGLAIVERKKNGNLTFAHMPHEGHWLYQRRRPIVEWLTQPAADQVFYHLKYRFAGKARLKTSYRAHRAWVSEWNHVTGHWDGFQIGCCILSAEEFRELRDWVRRELA